MGRDEKIFKALTFNDCINTILCLAKLVYTIEKYDEIYYAVLKSN